MNRAGWFVVAACLGYFSWRLFAPPVIGIANNGDFAKIAGSLHLGPASTGTDDRFLYVTRDYKRGPEYAWDSRYMSSEAIFARIAFRFARIFQHRDRFDIRWMGVAHLGVILLALAWMMMALRPLGAATQIAAGMTACLILGDAAYLGYCNSFFTDAAALAGLLLTMAALMDLAVRGYSRWRLAGFLCGALLLVASKSQHAAMALPLAVLIFVLTPRRVGLATGLAILGAALLFVQASPSFYRGDPIFNLIFYKLTPTSPSAPQDLAALGLASDQLRYVGTHAYSPGAPTSDMDYEVDLVRRASFGRIVRFYVSRPARAAAILRSELREHAPIIQPDELGNYTADSGHKPRDRAPGYWVRPQRQLLERFPWLMPVWLLAIAAVCLAVRSKLAWICLGVVAMAVIEFGVASLLDALDTSRHLLLFHVLLEITICFAIGSAVRVIYRSEILKGGGPLMVFGHRAVAAKVVLDAERGTEVQGHGRSATGNFARGLEPH